MVFKDAINDEEYIQYFGDIDVSKLKDIVQTTLSTSGYYVQYPYANNLLLSIILALYRIYKKAHTPDDYFYDHNTSEYRLAKQITNRFFEHYQCEAKDSDVCYIASLFQGQILENSKKSSEFVFDKEFESKISSLLLSTFDDFDIHIDISAYIHNFSSHILELIKRGRFGNYVVDDSSNYMKEKCAYIYDVAVHFTNRLEKEYKLSIPEDEISFIAVHIGLIISSESTQSNTVSILFYVSKYRGISDRILPIIQSKYQDQTSILCVDPAFQQIPQQDFDLIITTESLDIIGKNVINITPFFDIVDKSNVDSAISDCIKGKQKKKEYVSMIKCFSSDLFFVRQDIDTSDKAIEFLGKKLINYGIAEKDFIESVRAREALSATSFFDSFAIPHSIENNANRTMFAVLINENGIQWNNTKVKMCLMIAMRKKDLQEFPNLYDGIVRILCDPLRFSKLLEAKNLQDFLNTLK